MSNVQSKFIDGRPTRIGEFNLAPGELCFVQDLPIKFPETTIRVREELRWCDPLIKAAHYDQGYRADERYMYLTVRHMFCSPGKMVGRPGWHIDGFLTDDETYLWSNVAPTQFTHQPLELTLDHEESLREMSSRLVERNTYSGKPNVLYHMDNTVIHRVSTEPFTGYRAFVKINFSRNRYNLQGNAHNRAFDYSWEMHPRNPERNHPTKEE